MSRCALQARSRSAAAADPNLCTFVMLAICALAALTAPPFTVTTLAGLKGTHGSADATGTADALAQVATASLASR